MSQDIFSNNQNTPLRPLTAKEKKVLEFIESYLQTMGGVAPSYKEIKEHFGFASYNSVQRYLKQLQNKGYIHVPGGNQKRAITVLQHSSSIQTALNQKPSFAGSRFNEIVHNSSDARRRWAVRDDFNPFVSTNQHPKTPLEPSAPKRRPLNVQMQGATEGGAETYDLYVAQADRQSNAADGRLGTASAESYPLPLLGRVAAGRPLEAIEHDEFIDAPSSWVRHPEKTFALRVEGQSMIEDGIFDNDVIFVQKQQQARNGETVVATVENEATVKHFYLHQVTPSLINKNPQLTAHSQGSYVVELRPANKDMESFWHSPDEVEIQGIVVGLIRTF